MAMTTSDVGVIRSNEMYTLDRLKTILNLAEGGWRTLRDAGLPWIEKGNRKYILGEDVIKWFATQPRNVSVYDPSLRSGASADIEELPTALAAGEQMAAEVIGEVQRKGRRTRRART